MAPPKATPAACEPRDRRAGLKRSATAALNRADSSAASFRYSSGGATNCPSQPGSSVVMRSSRGGGGGERPPQETPLPLADNKWLALSPPPIVSGEPRA